MQHLPDFPPLPECFSHLVVSADGEPHSHSSHLSLSESISHSLSRLSARGEGLLQQDPQLDHYIMNGPGCAVSEASQSAARDISALNLLLPQNTVPAEAAVEDNQTDSKNPFVRLHTSLLTLQREMKDLRYLDISLFCQLLSLHEAVQEFKMSFTDRYSETGSEYSLGSASRLGSMSSLNDDSDWGPDGTLLTSSHEPESSEVGDHLDDHCHSASSILMQINELIVRADSDF